MRFANRLLLIAAMAAALAPAPAARALGISPNPFLVVDSPLSSASVTLVSVVSGLPAGGIVLDGAVAPGDTTLVLRVEVLNGSTPTVAFGVQPIASPASWLPLAGAGWIPGPDQDISSAGSGVPGSIGFVATSLSVPAGEAFDLLFLSYSSPPATDGSLELVAGIQLAPVQTGAATIVPEPGTTLLVAAGLAGLAWRRS